MRCEPKVGDIVKLKDVGKCYWLKNKLAEVLIADPFGLTVSVIERGRSARRRFGYYDVTFPSPLERLAYEAEDK